MSNAWCGSISGWWRRRRSRDTNSSRDPGRGIGLLRFRGRRAGARRGWATGMADDAQMLASRPASNAVKFGEGFVLDAWYVAALSPELKPGKMEAREDLGEPVVIGRTRAGAVYALRDVCPHRAAKLSAGKVRAEAGGGETVECPYHGWRFHTDGACA